MLIEKKERMKIERMKIENRETKEGEKNYWGIRKEQLNFKMESYEVEVSLTDNF